MSKIGFIGVGTMGSPMARNIARGGHDVQAFDLNGQAVAALADAGIRPAATAAEAASGKDFVISMLPNSQHVEGLLFGPEGIADALGRNTLYVDMSTIAPTVTRTVAARLADKGISMVDAPVGRQQQHAVEGKLLIMVGGAESDVARVRPILDLMGDTIIHCGPVGSGGAMKIVNNFMSITINLAAAEALILGEKAGLDIELARKVMLGTVAGQGHFGTTYPAKVLKGDLDPGFMIDLAAKDLGLAVDFAEALGAPLDSGKLAREKYAEASAAGRGRQDWTALYDYLRKG
ncbi:MAG: sulfolactaldehyde 3-reductase [Rhizobiaceae bacterium]|nr:sulfolactaldehyde 3-reductase [Rhizobiaceae bacterium]MCV0407414.1 sulfolactaldehyde 3-reductase [Rhizobiaceae bacterium]